MNVKLVTLTAAAVLALGLAGTASAQTLRVGAYAANPPWEFKTTEGAFEGFEIDLVTAIAERLGMELEIEDLGFQALFAATSSNRIDAAISSITITSERLQSQSFTQGYYDADLALATNRNSGITGLADMEGEVAGVLSTSTGDIWAQQNQQEYGFSDILGYNTQQEMILDTQLGRSAGAISDITGFMFSFENMPEMTVVERIPTGDQYALMMSKDHPLLGEVNEAITALKQDGTMAELHEKWLGGPAESGASTITVLEIPQAQ